MIYNLVTQHNLRGYGFEYISKVLLRRTQKNNFIFQLCLFDSIEEILTKYRLRVSPKYIEFIEYAKEEWNRCDLIEFNFEMQNDERVITHIMCYDVKTKHMNAKRDYFEVCISNDKFMRNIQTLGVDAKIISVVLFENWRFSLNIFDYNKSRIRTFSHYKKV